MSRGESDGNTRCNSSKYNPLYIIRCSHEYRKDVNLNIEKRKPDGITVGNALAKKKDPLNPFI